MTHVALRSRFNGGNVYWCGAGWSNFNAILVDLEHVEWMKEVTDQATFRSNSALSLKYELSQHWVAVPVADLPPDVVITGVLMPYTGAANGH